jgi:hypothetical protein
MVGAKRHTRLPRDDPLKNTTYGFKPYVVFLFAIAPRFHATNYGAQTILGVTSVGGVKNALNRFLGIYIIKSCAILQ